MNTQRPNRISGTAAALALLISMLMHFEGTRLGAYYDITGKLTICTGETNGVYKGQRATMEECRDMTAWEAMRSLSAVDSDLAEHPGVDRWAGLGDFEYNVGRGAWRKSAVRRKINAGDIAGGCAALLAYDKVRVRGVLRVSHWQQMRRAKEYRLCLAG